MKILGLDLDNSPLLTENKSLKYALNIEVNNKCLSYFNEKSLTAKFTIPKDCIIIDGNIPTTNEWNNSTINVIGTINCPFNIILFVIITGDITTKAILSYNTKTNKIDKSYCYNNFNFNIENPIQGVYTYFKDDLIIIYTDQTNELQILNITSFKETLYNELNGIDINKLNFIPDNSFNLSVKEGDVNTGSLLTGSYQIAVKFKTVLGHYTNYSTLSETINIYGDDEALKVGSLTSKSININIELLNNINIYKYYKIAIVYNNGESQLAYETNDIEIINTSIINYIISDINILNIISLEDIFIKNINYSYATDISIMNNQLIAGGVKKINHNIENNKYPSVQIGCKPISIENAIKSKKPFFQAGEIYIFYLALFDKKGDLINIKPLPYHPFTTSYDNYGSCAAEYLTIENELFGAYKMPYSSTSNLYEVCARVLYDHSSIDSNISSYQILYIEHNYTNSKILTQGVVIPDTYLNDFENQQYLGQFQNEYCNVGNVCRYNTKYRLYSFDLLFNKTKNLPNIAISKLSDIQFKSDPNLEFDSYEPTYTPVFKWDDTDKQLKDYDENGIKYGIIDYDDINFNNNSEISDLIKTVTFINNGDSNNNNIAGDSYHRIVIQDAQNLVPGLYNIYNSDYKYSSLNNQKLQVASSIQNLYSQTISESTYESIISLKGDSYIDYLTLRATTPAPSYFHGDNQYPERDSNKTVYRWIIIAPLISKLNIKAHYSTPINKVFKLETIKKYPNSYSVFYDPDFIELIDLSYERDHPINNDLDINYSKVYNENGIENFVYGESLITNNKYTNRIIRSLYQNDESNNFNLTTFKANDYKDLPAKYGEITVINNNDQFLYVHQKYNLSYLSIRDTLTSDQIGDSYLASSDLFNIEAKSLLYNPTGFISCISKFDTLINETGYYCIDNETHQIFKINKDSIKDITSENVKYWFKNNLITLEKNNPYNKQGRYLNFDNENNTLYIVQNIIDNDFTLSFNTIINKWISFHSYIPVIGLNNNFKIYWIDNKKLFVKDIYVHGYHLNNGAQPSYLKFILNPYPTYNKFFKTIVWLDRVINTTTHNNLPVDKTFKQIAILTDKQCSDWQLLNNINKKWYESKSGVNIINQWRFNEIWDVSNGTFQTEDPVIFDREKLTNTKWYKRNKIYDQFAYVIFQIDAGITQHEVIDIDVEFDLDNRNQQLKDKKE